MNYVIYKEPPAVGADRAGFGGGDGYPLRHYRAEGDSNWLARCGIGRRRPSYGGRRILSDVRDGRT